MHLYVLNVGTCMYRMHLIRVLYVLNAPQKHATVLIVNGVLARLFSQGGLTSSLGCVTESLVST